MAQGTAPGDLQLIEEEKDEINTRQTAKWSVNAKRPPQKQKNTDLKISSGVLHLM